MKISEIKIGQQVNVIPKPTFNEDGSVKHHPVSKMWVRELHNPNFAGLSHKKNGKSIYGILYDIIQPA